MKTEAIDEVPNRGEYQWQHKENVPGGGSSSQERMEEIPVGCQSEVVWRTGGGG